MTIIEWIRFRNRFLKNPTDENRLAFTRERKFCLSLPRKDNKQYFAKLNEKNITIQGVSDRYWTVCAITFYITYFLKMKTTAMQIMLVIPPYTLLVAQ